VLQLRPVPGIAVERSLGVAACECDDVFDPDRGAAKDNGPGFACFPGGIFVRVHSVHSLGASSPLPLDERVIQSRRCRLREPLTPREGRLRIKHVVRAHHPVGEPVVLY